MRVLLNRWVRKPSNCTTGTALAPSLRDEAWSAHRRVGKQCRHLPSSPVWYARPNFVRISSVDRNDEGKRHAALDGAGELRPHIAKDWKVSHENRRVSPDRCGAAPSLT